MIVYKIKKLIVFSILFIKREKKIVLLGRYRIWMFGLDLESRKIYFESLKIK